MRPLIFISYSHDSNAHIDRALSLADRLRYDGLDVRLDQYLVQPPEGWMRWMQRQLEEADFVLFVCTPSYRRRFDGHELSGLGQGANWEGFLAQQILFDAGSLNHRFIPILFEDGAADDIPLVLRSATRYRLPLDYDDFYRRLTGQPKTIAPPIGAIRLMPPVSINTTHTSLTRPASAPTPYPALGPAQIRLFTANAAFTDDRLALDNELRAITDALQRARHRDRYDLRISPAITFTQLLHELDDHILRFIHFSGHGGPSGALILKTADFQDELVSAESLRECFAAQRNRPDLVVFATCGSRDLAAAVAPHVGYAIGFTGALDDRAASTFSAVLYERLAGHDPPDIPRAFRLACLAAASTGFLGAEHACLFDHTGASL